MKKNYPYSKLVMKHFLHPKNKGSIKNPSGVGKVGNLLCGDIMHLYIKIKKDKNGKERITDAKFETFGCVVAISVSSMLTTLVKGKTIEEALKITKNDILKISGKLPPIKLHCSVLAVDALSEALYDYFSKNKLQIPKELSKRHENIMRALKTIEEKHKEYLKLEEKMLKEK